MNTDQSAWRKPDNDLINKALSRIGDIQHRRLFFERLENPLWVSALEQQGVFAPPLHVRRDNEGPQYWQIWPEGEYLVRMAPLIPDQVARILLKSTDSRNPVVHEILLRAALALPADEAASFVRPIENYLRLGTIGHAPEVLELIEHLAKHGLTKPTVRLAQAAFRPRRQDDELKANLGRRPNVDVVAGLEPFWYGELLPRVAEALDRVQGIKTLSTLVAWLEEFQIVSGGFDQASNYDLSYIWRASIAPHDQNDGFEDYGDNLVDAVRDRALQDLEGGRPLADVLQVLERNGQPLLRRIALHAIAARLAVDSVAQAEAERRLLDPTLLDGGVRHEYVELARAALPLFSSGAVLAWQTMVFDGPPISDDDLRMRLADRRAEGENLPEAVARYRDHWQLRLLSGVGRNGLPSEAVKRLDALEKKYQRLEHAEFPSYSTSWVGPASPRSSEELSDLGLHELLPFLRSWTPDANDPKDFSREGLARALQSTVRKRASEMAANADKFDGLNPTYIRALFEGLREALGDDHVFPWEPVLRLGAVVAAQPDEGLELDGAVEEDVVWRFAQRALASLLEMGAGVEGPKALGVDDLVTAVDVLAPLIGHADPTPEHEERYGGSNMDPLTLSLNTTRPAALRALIRVASREKDVVTHNPEDRVTASIQRALELAEEHLGPMRDASLAEAAAFGEGFGRLIWIDREWLVGRRDELLTPDIYGDIVFSIALARYRPSKMMIEVVEPFAVRLLERIAAGEQVTSGWRTDRSPVEILGDHLVLMLIQGVIGQDHDLMRKFFALAPTASIARVLGRLGWQFGRWDAVPPEMVERAMALWDARAEGLGAGDARLEELAEFYWWVGADKFPRRWWLPRLEQASEAATFNPRGLLGEPLEHAAPEAPDIAARVLERLLSGRENPFERYDLVNHAPGVIVAALDSGDPATEAIAERLMDALGREGHLHLKDTVAQYRERSH
jgi:hypothetical protein